MIPRQKDRINKSIYIYLLLLVLISSVNNKNFYNKELFSKKLVYEINGLSNKEKQKLVKDLTDKNYKNIFNLSKEKLSSDVNKNNLVLDFSAKKNYPNKINITINKATKVGKIYKNKKLFLIGSNGKLINYDINQKIDLPYFYGNFNRDQFLEFLTLINKIGLNKKDISSFYLFPSGRWDILFKNELLIKLPKKDVNNALLKLLFLRNNQSFKDLKIIDLRIKNRVITNG